MLCKPTRLITDALFTHIQRFPPRLAYQALHPSTCVLAPFSFQGMHASLRTVLHLCPHAGWPSVDAYYAGSCSSLSVPNITIPFLCLQALDDPIAPAEAIPYAALKANPNATLVGTPCGGHLGWIAGSGAPFGEPWSDKVCAVRCRLEKLWSYVAFLRSCPDHQCVTLADV